ncbi:MAG: agmatinase [Bacteroidia bacterium]|nr:MAG: agmatinase [Bacteroidia bacterium]
MENFDINQVGLKNGKIFGLPFEYENAKVIIQPIPWEVTVSYQSGTAKGPKAILEASPQLDFFDFLMPNAWEKGIFMLPIDKELYKLNKFLREQVEDYIASIENSSANAYEIYDELIEQINKECKLLNNRIEQQTLQILHDNKIPGLLGGDHSTPLGNIKAVIQKYPEVTILHIDAHADLRPAYEGFTYSHASIMYNVLEETSIKKIVQVGIRDFCHQEYELSQSDHRILTFYDKKLKELYFQGRPWGSIVLDIIKNLGHEVYISLDIDALQPYYCPDTGTPVPGGLSFDEVTYLIDSVVKSGKKIVGFDLVEVAPNKKNPINEIVGARLLYKLCVACIASEGNKPKIVKKKPNSNTENSEIIEV